MRRLVSVGGLAACVWAVAASGAVPGPDLQTAVAPVDDGGTWLPGTAPSLPESELPVASLDRVRQHLEAGDTVRALRDARRLAEGERWGRARDAAWMVVGVLEEEAGHHNLASEAYTRVRSAEGPLSALASFREAEQDLARGRPWATIKECERFREKWPDDDHAADCLRLVAVAQAGLGQADAARATALAYDQDHPKGPISEQIELHLALRLSEHRPEQSVGPLRQLALHHDAALTGRVAEEVLSELAADGVPGAGVPDDAASRMARAISLRDAARREEAWALFTTLRGDTDPAVRAFVAAEEERFAWRCWRWDDLADRYGRAMQEKPGADLAWDLYRVLARGSRFDEAASLALEMQAAYPSSSAWRRSQEEVGRTMMLAGRYGEAVVQFDKVAARGGWGGQRARFLAGFAALMSGDAKDAVARFEPLVGVGGEVELEARYWRSQAWDALEQAEQAEADRRWVVETDPWSWYAVLVRQRDPGLPTVAPYARDGGWPGTAAKPTPAFAPEAPTPTAAEPTWLAAAAAGGVVLPAERPGAPGFGEWTWSWDRPDATPPVHASQVTPPRLEANPVEPPASYRAGALFDPASGREGLRRLADASGGDFPELLEIADLASAGLYDLAGTRMSGFYEKLRTASRRGSGAARRLLAAPSPTWRDAFLTARDHHHTARQLYGAWDTVEDPALVQEAWRLAYPLAHDRFVWTHGREHDVDPMMVLGLMRQESTYNPVAVSPVGARGAMQIMPRTGHLLADLAHDVDFNAGDLEDPVFAVGYGIRYLGLLMQRYDGVFPLAVASYNGGPHNVSSWLGGTGLDVPTDVFVEHIAFKETRDYVKKVTAGYAAYVALYAPEGSAVVVPPRPTGNHREIVDF